MKAINRQTNTKKINHRLSVNPFPDKPLYFTCLYYKYFENTVGKGEIARTKQLTLFPHCFKPYWRNFCHFHQN